MFLLGGGRLEKAVKDFYVRLVTDADNQLAKRLEAVTTLNRLTEDISRLKIEKSQIEEQYDKREREIEHKLGLERQRQEQTLDIETRKAKLQVQEDNLKLDRKRFEEQMTFHEKRFTEEVSYLKDMIKPLLEALPKMTIKETNTRRR